MDPRTHDSVSDQTGDNQRGADIGYSQGCHSLERNRRENLHLACGGAHNNADLIIAVEAGKADANRLVLQSAVPTTSNLRSAYKMYFPGFRLVVFRVEEAQNN